MGTNKHVYVASEILPTLTKDLERNRIAPGRLCQIKG